jgi:RHS repeat-associated protein
LYDGWNLVAEPDGNASNAKVRTYAWGSDLSGSMQGAGGIGGLLKVTQHGPSVTHHFAVYDGNGNVMGLVNAADGSFSARCEYGPFGEPIRVSGPMSTLNPIRFSPKYTDDQSGLVYYEYRYYNSMIGRWTCRDPIEETGGSNLVASFANDTLNYSDLLGLKLVAVTKKVEWWNKWWADRIEYVLLAGWSRNSLEVKMEMSTNDGCTSGEPPTVQRNVTSRLFWEPELKLEQGPTLYAKQSPSCPCGVTCYSYTVGYRWKLTILSIRLPQVGHKIPILSSFQQTVIDLRVCADGTVSAQASNSQNIAQVFPWTENPFEERESY